MRALTIGRFQPFHSGHLELVLQALEKYDEVIIAVTSSQFNYTEKDPFTAGERLEMIQESLKEAGIDASRCFIIPLENQFNIATWHAYLESILPRFDIVISGNEYVSMLLKRRGVEVVRPRFLDRTRFNASRVRRMMASGEPWEDLVPPAVARIIREMDGVNRLKVISESDTNPTEH